MKVSELIKKLVDIASENRWDVDVNILVEVDTVSDVANVQYDPEHGGDGIILS